MFVLVTPAHNEVACVAELVACVRGSRLPPDLWVVVDDRSTDGTGDALRAAATDLPLRVVPSGSSGGYMGFRYSEVLRAGLAAAGELESISRLGILDCDIRFGPDYWGDLAAALDAQPRPGIVSGNLCAPTADGGWRLEDGQRIDLPRGGLRLVAGPCLRSVGGIAFSRAPDSVMTVLARTRGFGVALLPEVLAVTVRGTDSRWDTAGDWESRGRRAYNVGQARWQVRVRAADALRRGRGRAARALLAGYRDERRAGVQIADPDVVRYYRRERPAEWLRSLRCRATGQPDPHRYLAGRPVSADEISWWRGSAH